MSLFKYVAGFAFFASLAACGGGGGNAGTPSGGTPVVIVSAYPTLSGVFQDSAGSATSSISASGYTVLRVALTDPSGKGIPDQVVSATADETKVVFPEGSGGLTNAAGVATIKVARASLFATGADTLTVTYSYKAGSFTRYPNGSVPPSADKVVANYVGYQLSASNITLTNLNIGSPNLAAYGTRQVSVQANINGAAVSSTPVQVSFSANCGSVTPATASTNSQGVVQVSYSATNPAVLNDQGCSGSNVSIVASTTGATPVAGNLSIDVAPATNLVFVDATPTTIFLAGSGGPTQSVVKFRLINASNSALQGQNILLELKDLSGGIPKTSFGTVGNIAAITRPTNSGGEVSVPVFSGTVPTNVSVKATLISNGAVTTTSAVLAIASGRAVQSRASLAVKELSIEGANTDGVITQVTMSLADRQGNPVPDGTAINFVTEGGVMIPPFCTTLKSTCSVELRSQNPRPVDGRVSVLAYAAGEEDFTDLNFDNTYTLGEPFTDLGNAFKQDAALVGGVSGSYVEGYFSVPRAGQIACNGGFLGRPNSCDGVWGAVDVRQQAVVIFATGPAVISAVSQSTSNLTFSVADGYSNSVPTGSVIDVTSSSNSCRIASGGSAIVANSLYPAVFSVGYSADGFPCTDGALINVKLTTPRGTVTTRSFAVPAAAAPALTVLSGTSMTVVSANSRTTIVSGGTAPYSVSSSAPASAKATLSSATLVIEGVAAGTSTVIISDAAGASYSIAVTVTGP